MPASCLPAHTLLHCCLARKCRWPGSFEGHCKSLCGLASLLPSGAASQPGS